MKIAVWGAKGRVGSRVVALARQKHQVWEVDKDTAVPSEDVDVVVDFSLPQATKQVCDFCLAHRCPLVTGTTGRNACQQQLVDNLKKHVPVCQKANFSKGMALLQEICKILAEKNWDCDVVEIHRKGKRDRPGGTAVEIAKILIKNGTRDVTVHSLRNGSNFGMHQVVFGAQGESLTVTHQAENVDIFALGALEQAEILVKATQEQ